MREKITYKYKDSLWVYWRIDIEPVCELVNGFWRWEMFVYQSPMELHTERPWMTCEFESTSVNPSIHECVTNLNASLSTHFLRFAMWGTEQTKEREGSTPHLVEFCGSLKDDRPTVETIKKLRNG